MAQTECEASLRLDYLTTSFRSASRAHQEECFDLAQFVGYLVSDRYAFEEARPSAHFERAFAHPAGIRFEYSSPGSGHNAGVSKLDLAGSFWGVASDPVQMQVLEQLLDFKGRYRFTRADLQVTTLNPSHSAAQVLEDVIAGRLWIKGYAGYEPAGVRDINGKLTKGVTVYFGSRTSAKRCRTYDKAAEQGWEIPARRDEIQLRDRWSNEHVQLISKAIAGSKTEDEAIAAYRSLTSAAIAQHMQYLDIDGIPRPMPKNWARGRKAPKWWAETLDQSFTPVLLNRRVTDDLDEKVRNGVEQYGKAFGTWIMRELMEGRSAVSADAFCELGARFLTQLNRRDIEAFRASLPPDQHEEFDAVMDGLLDAAAVTAEHSR